MYINLPIMDTKLHITYSVAIVLFALLLLHQVSSQEQTSVSTSSTPTVAPTARAPPPPPRVKLNKCCQLGEYLNATTQSCMAGSSELWVPLVYLIQQQRFFDPAGGSPRFMKFLPNRRPNCSRTDNGAVGSNPEDLVELFSARLANVVIFPNGTLYVRERVLLVDPSDYCVDRDVALVCRSSNPIENQVLNITEIGSHNSANVPPTPLRLRKCCGKWNNYNPILKNCNVNMISGDGQLKLEPQLEIGSYQTTYGLPECTNGGGYAIAGDWPEAHLNHSTGSIRLQHTNLTASEYCLEHTHGREDEVKIIACTKHFIITADSGKQLQQAIITGGLLVSVVFLAATLVAGYMLPAVHHALHWKCQIYYIFCLLVGKILLAIEELNTSIPLDTPLCLLLAVGIQFFFLSAFFWLNTMCFNIWWTFRDFRPSSLERNQEALRLRLYSIYAWGVPLLICSIAVCVDQLVQPSENLLRPGFGQHYCWFDKQSLPILAYFFGPIGLLLCLNIALFISTTHQLTCGLWKRDDVKSSSEKSALVKVCLKLVVVMGITWIADLISWIVGGPDSTWLIIDLINALQGVFIFIVVGCQPQVWTACRRICCPRLRHDITNTTNGVQHSSSSQGLPSMAGGGGYGTEFTQNTSLNVPPIVVNSEQCQEVNKTDGDINVTDGTTTIKKIPMETVC